MVTAELAVAIPSLVLVLGLVVGGLSLGIDEIRCIDAARVGARALARGDDQGAAESVARRVAPPAATIGVAQSQTEVTVDVSVRRSLLGAAGLVLHATSVAQRESP